MRGRRARINVGEYLDFSEKEVIFVLQGGSDPALINLTNLTGEVCCRKTADLFFRAARGGVAVRGGGRAVVAAWGCCRAERGCMGAPAAPAFAPRSAPKRAIGPEIGTAGLSRPCGDDFIH